MRDIKPLLLLLLSIGLVGTWAYHLYDKTQYAQIEGERAQADSAAAALAIKDSLHAVYSSTISDLDNKLTTSYDSLSVSQDSLETTRVKADSLQKRLQLKLVEINRLKSEISGILNNGNASTADMTLARQKIEELQQRVAELQTQNNSMEEEKRQLSATFTQLSQTSDKLEQNIRRLTDENASLNAKIESASLFVASEIKLSAVNLRSTKEQETSQYKKADKFVISFILQNNVNSYDNAEVMISIIQPDRQVLQNSNWDSGAFDTKSDGRKNYTRKVKFDYAKSERKELNFTLDPEEFQKGNYVLQVWHRGVMIGQAVDGLN